MHNRKKTALHTVIILLEKILADLFLPYSSLKTFVEGIFVTSTLNVGN